MDIQWDVRAIRGNHRWLNRVWLLCHDHANTCKASDPVRAGKERREQLFSVDNVAIKQVWSLLLCVIIWQHVTDSPVRGHHSSPSIVAVAMAAAVPPPPPQLRSFRTLILMTTMGPIKVVFNGRCGLWIQSTSFMLLAFCMIDSGIWIVSSFFWVSMLRVLCVADDSPSWSTLIQCCSGRVDDLLQQTERF